MVPEKCAFSEEDRGFFKLMEGRFEGKVAFRDQEISSYDDSDLNGSILENSFVYDNNFFRHDFHGPQKPGGRTLLGTGYIGFNAAKKQFQSVWLDNQHQSMNFDWAEKKGNELIKFWQQPDTVSEKEVGHSSVTTVFDKDHHRVDFFLEDPVKGKRKTLSMDFTRQ